MEHTIDSEFGSDSSVLGVLVVAGAAIGSLFAGWLITKICINKALAARLDKLEGIICPAKAVPVKA